MKKWLQLPFNWLHYKYDYWKLAKQCKKAITECNDPNRKTYSFGELMDELNK